MEDKIEKYNRIREKIKEGDIVLFRGSSWLSKTIQWADSSYFNHSGLVISSGNRLMILDSNAPGVKPEFLSERIEEYVDFTIIQPVLFKEEFIKEAVEAVIRKDLKKHFKYDFMLLPKVLVAKKVGIPVDHNLTNSNRTICSVFTGFHYALELGYKPWVEKTMDQGYLTPQDHIRYMDEQFKILE